MNDIYDIINNRSTCRSFTDEEIKDEILNKILHAACNTPSASGFQTYSIIKIKNSETKRSLSKLCRNQAFIEKAPVCLVFCIDYRRIMRINEVIPAPCGSKDNFMKFWMAVLDTAISAHTACLTAESESLNSVYIGNIVNSLDRVSDLLKLPKYVVPSIMLVLGHPKTKSKLSKKYGADVIVHDEFYKDMEIDDLMNAYEKKYEDWKMPNTDSVMNKIYETCLQLNGQQLAEQFKEYAVQNNKISPYQYWYGYYYIKQNGFLDYQGYINYMKKQGFEWLK